jgi:RNA polymerase sigma factor (sigma-70 family)
MSNDSELLRQYHEERSESAFTQLVREHVNLVYSAALRESNGNEALAEDLSQAVFTELARKSSRLLGHPSLAGWLYTTVRHLAANLRRADHRRRRREVELMNELLSVDTPDQSWLQVRPVLDDALHELKEAERAALVLRFLENRSLQEVGAALGLEENAARMRVDRALDKLRKLLARRGITSTASGLATVFALGAVTPAPEGLAATLASTAVASGGVAGSTTLILAKLMSITKVTVVGALVVAGIAVPTWQQTRLQKARSETQQQLLATESELGSRLTELTSLSNQVARLRKVEVDQAELVRLKQWQAQTEPELLRLRGMAGVARRANAEAESLRAQLARQATEPATNPVSGAMADAMRLAMEQQVNGRLSRMKSSLSLTPDQEQAARDILARQGQAMAAGMEQAFSGKFDKEELARLGKNAGNPDEQIKAILGPEQQAAFPNYQQEEAAYNARLAANSELLQLQTTLGLTPQQQDGVFAALYDLSFNQMTGNTKPPLGNQAEVMQWTLDQKAKALEPLLTPSQLQNYQQQQQIQAKLAKDILSKMQSTGGSN